jgi:hypothetical protein
MSANGTGVPDLLRRFTPAPHCVRVRFRQFDINLQTNDAELAVAMEPAVGAQTKGSNPPSLLMRVIRDDEAPSSSSQLTRVTCGPLVTLLLGAGTMLTMDCERYELLGFLAPAVPVERVLEELLPLLLDCLNGGTSSTGRTQTGDSPAGARTRCNSQKSDKSAMHA